MIERKLANNQDRGITPIVMVRDQQHFLFSDFLRKTREFCDADEEKWDGQILPFNNHLTEIKTAIN